LTSLGRQPQEPGQSRQEPPKGVTPSAGASSRQRRAGSDLPHPAPLLRHAPADKRLRYPDRAGASRAQEREDHDDLHSRPQPWRPEGAESCGPPV